MDQKFSKGLNLRYDVDLRNLSTWKIGGPLHVLAEPTTDEGAAQALELAERHAWPVLLLGNGSNLLFDDRGFEGMAIRPPAREQPFQLEGEELIIAPAGRMLSSLARCARRAGSSALGWMATVPGCVGGSLVNNAGAFGREMADHLEWVEALDLKTFGLVRLQAEQIDFGYRQSNLRGSFLILRAAFRLEAVEKRDFSDFARQRKKTQPLSRPSCGCVFKNPVGDSAGKLIELCGLKGFRLGDAEVSALHANFILNQGKASSIQVEELIQQVQSFVEDRCGVRLEREVQFLREAILKRA